MVASNGMELLTEMDTKQFMGTPIQQYFYKKSIFLTGATGFMGKTLMEKLLRTCDVEVFYILVRTKKGKGTTSRLEEIFNDPLFEKLKREKPKFRNRVIGISGDCVLPGLGISPEDRTLLAQNVNVVFHGAATVRFDEKLKYALGINVNGTKEIITLAKEMKNLEAFIHVSTAYANCNHSEINEVFYKPPVSGENAIKLSEALDDTMLDAITPEIIKGYPNTYTFTKCLAEDLVKTQGANLPAAIFRPAVVIATAKEPVAGWIDNHFGPTGIVVGVGAGLLRVVQVDKNLRAELVPVDLCVNSMIAAAWEIATEKPNDIPVFNYVTDKDNKITWKQYTEYGIQTGGAIPTSRAIWYYTVTLTASRFFTRFLQIFYHFLPAIFMDAGLMFTGRNPKMFKIYKKIHKFCDVVSYFNTRPWTFTNDNVKALWKKLDPRDQKIYNFDMATLDWKQYSKDSMYGMRTYLMKDDPSTIPDAIKRMKKLKALHYVVVYGFNSLVLYMLYVLLSKIFYAFL